jgi:hypothetical protein
MRLVSVAVAFCSLLMLLLCNVLTISQDEGVDEFLAQQQHAFAQRQHLLSPGAWLTGAKLIRQAIRPCHSERNQQEHCDDSGTANLANSLFWPVFVDAAKRRVSAPRADLPLPIPSVAPQRFISSKRQEEELLPSFQTRTRPHIVLIVADDLVSFTPDLP